jgi:hypothetical protein
MSSKVFALRFVGLILIALAAGPLYALVMNLLLATEQITPDMVEAAFGSVLTNKCVYIWLGCLLLGFGSLFAQENWRYVLYFSPLYAPSLFAILYTMMQ